MWARSIRQFGGLDRPIPIEALLPRLRPNSNEPGCITDESVAIRESYSNIQVQTRGVLVVEGESHSYVGESGPRLCPPSKQGTSICAFVDGPGFGGFDSPNTIRPFVSHSIVRSGTSSSKGYIAAGVNISGCKC